MRRCRDLATVIAQRDAAEQALRGLAQAPSGLANLCAIVADQPFQNSALSVYEINLILANTGSFMPDEAVMWFRASRGTFGVAQTPSHSPPVFHTPHNPGERLPSGDAAAAGGEAQTSSGADGVAAYERGFRDGVFVGSQEKPSE